MSTVDNDLHLLPSTMQMLAKSIGLPAVMALVKTHGGLAPLYVPIKVTPDHYLVRLVGIEAFTKLVAEYGGDTIEIPKCERAMLETLYQQIKRESLDDSHEKLAGRYGYSLRHIRNIVGDVVDDRQAGLF
jgi:hypothetical protein